MRIWVKEFKDNRMIKDTVVEKNEPDTSRTKKVFSTLEEVCHDWDLAVPIWLNANINDFKRLARTRFTQDNFTETIGFDYLDFQVIEE